MSTLTTRYRLVELFIQEVIWFLS